MFNEKRYSKHGYEYVECPRCYGRGAESMGVFSKIDCPKCDGSGTLMVENSREMEMATHRQSDSNNEHKNRWLFS
jgi:DnaJ-class molecular chaperone